MAEKKSMLSATLRLIIASLIMTTAIVSYSTVKHGPRSVRNSELSLRQKVDLVYVNGVRNALRTEDSFRQGALLREALEDVRQLRAAANSVRAEDEKRVAHRVRQLERMIARKTPIDSL